MQKKIQSLCHKETGELVKLLPKTQLENNKLVYKKENPIEVEKQVFKATLVAKGCLHQKGVDYNEVYVFATRQDCKHFIVV